MAKRKNRIDSLKDEFVGNDVVVRKGGDDDEDVADDIDPVEKLVGVLEEPLVDEVMALDPRERLGKLVSAKTSNSIRKPQAGR